MCRCSDLYRLLGMLGLTLLFAVQTTFAEEQSAVQIRLAELVSEIRSDYPDVRHISVAELKTEFADALLVDVRERDEYEVSHLPGAVHASVAADIDALRAQYPARALVFYCTVGVRSAIAVRDFNARWQSSAAAVNFAGSIFAWANASEPLEDAVGPTEEVHPFTTWWGLRYLDRARAE